MPGCLVVDEINAGDAAARVPPSGTTSSGISARTLTSAHHNKPGRAPIRRVLAVPYSGGGRYGRLRYDDEPRSLVDTRPWADRRGAHRPGVPPDRRDRYPKPAPPRAGDQPARGVRGRGVRR